MHSCDQAGQRFPTCDWRTFLASLLGTMKYFMSQEACRPLSALVMMFTLILGMITLTPGDSRAADPQKAPLPEKENFHLYLLVGQSNMAGRGEVSEADRTPHPRVLMFNKNKEWVPAVDPLHFDKPRAVGTGLGKTFGILVAESNPEITIGLIPCAVGGTSIDVWVPGALDSATKTHPWDDCMERAKLALQHGTLKGILWHQGESDANEKKVTKYEEKLSNLIHRFRTELQAPNVPFLLGQLGQFESRPWNEPRKKIDRIIRNVAEKTPNAAFVSSDGLTDKGDGTHFNAESYREFGKRYAEAYLKMVSGQ
jgi:hypothetical protein